MKAILLSIKPEWVEKILSGEKTIEIRKTMPKCELPIKCYIYCTKDNKNYLNRKDCRFCYIEKRDVLGITDKVRELFDNIDGFYERLNGKVVAEFTLNEVEDFLDGVNCWALCDDRKTCLSFDETLNYSKGNPLYAWYIDDLKIYDTPKELSEFKVYDKTYDNVGAFGWAFPEEQKYTPLKRPPQSWCYVEELGEEV